MEFFNKYRIRRIGLYITIIAIVFLCLGVSEFFRNTNIWGLDFNREPIKLKRVEIETYKADIQSLNEENGYIISRQKPIENKIDLPTEYESLMISADNTGCYIITAKVS